jgi:hypothetical protein
MYARKGTGVIVIIKERYNGFPGFGWIEDMEGVQRYFNEKYLRGVAFDDLELGDRVEFTPFVSSRGRRAEDVRRIAGVGERKTCS